MASAEYARIVLRLAGLNHANRNTKVVKRARAGLNKAHSAEPPPTFGVGSVSSPCAMYLGASERIWPSDPHAALFALAEVEEFLKACGRGSFRAVYIQWYVKGLTLARDGHLEEELADAFGSWIGFVEHEEEIVLRAQHQAHLNRALASEAERQRRAADRKEREANPEWRAARAKRLREARAAVKLARASLKVCVTSDIADAGATNGNSEEIVESGVGELVSV